MLRSLVSLVAPPLCIACGGDAGRATPLCPACRADLARTAIGSLRASGAAAAPGLALWSAFAYDGPAGAVVRALKFGGRVALADVMAAQMVAQAPPGVVDGDLVPVPAHPARMRRRGFGQAALLADALAARAGLRVVACLRREGDPAPQSSRGREARIRALEGVIRVGGRVPAPQRAVLVDDVVTTGSTLAACAAALRAGGCHVIGAITYARTGGR